MCKIPTTPTITSYRSKDGNSHNINSMSDANLLQALYDMLSRKAKHNHKINRIIAVNDTLSKVTKAIHQEIGSRNSNVTPLIDMQIAADLGKLSIVETEEEISITYQK